MQHKIVMLFFFIMVGTIAQAQTNGNSPYSRYGIGDIVDENFMHLRSMGSLGASYIDGYHINIVNPASYASLRATAFDLGMAAERSTLSAGDQSSTSWNGNLEYISLAFPLSNPLNELLNQEKKDYHLGMSFTLMPNSNVGYNIISDEVMEGLGDVTRQYKGEGGSYKVLWGNAIKYKDFSFGANLGFLFGKIRYERNVDFLSFENPYTNRFSSEYNLNGFLWGVGAIYSNVLNQKKLNDKTEREAKVLSIGVHMKAASNFNTNLTSLDEGVQSSGFGTVYRDTLNIVENEEGSGKLPTELGFGVSYFGGNKYMVGANFATTNWSSYSNDADKTLSAEGLNDTYSMSIGGFYRPNYKSYNRYFKRVYYRYGLFYKTDPRSVEGDQINQYGLTFGLGMPFIYQRKISHANLGFEFGKKGTGTPITESYFKISLGFTFNDDEWFVKSKYN